MKRVQFLGAAAVLGVCVLAVCVLGVCVLGVAGQPPSLGDRIVAFCKQQKGKCVGNGECSNLAEAALRAAGARGRGHGDFNRDDFGHGDFNRGDFGRGDFGRGGPSGGHHELAADYVWGELVFVLERDGTNLMATGQLKDIRPGDVIQFRDAELAGPSGGSRYTMSAKHHTAIVSGVLNKGMVLKIYQQNANGRRIVTADRLRLSDLQQGRLRIFHPLPRTRIQPTD